MTDLTFADAEANTDGVCPTCGGRQYHLDSCPDPRIGWARGDEVCDRCRNGLDAGEGYLAGTEPGPPGIAVGLVCLPCGFAEGAPDPSTTTHDPDDGGR